MEEKRTRSLGGRLALWVFYAYCGYFVWAMGRYVWVMCHVNAVPGAQAGAELGSTTGKWLGALLGFLVLGIVGLILGCIVWYTRPRDE